MMRAATAGFAANWRGNTTSDISIPTSRWSNVDLTGDRQLMLCQIVVMGAQLNETDDRRVLQHLADLWTYDISLV